MNEKVDELLWNIWKSCDYIPNANMIPLDSLSLSAKIN